MKSIGKAIVMMLLATAVTPARATASVMWAVDNLTHQVFTIDVNTRTATLVGPAGVGIALGGLGFASDGTLYAWNGLTTGSLYTVNQSTGAFTLVGSSSLTGGDTFDINPVTNEAIVWTVNGGLYNVDLATGSTSLRVNTTPTNPGYASAFSPTGVYYELQTFTDRLYTADIDTGVVTLIGSLGLDVLATGVGFNLDDNMLYAVQILDATPALYRINPATGAATNVGNVTGLPAGSVLTMATFQVTPPSQPVPEPGTMALVAMGLLGAMRSARRRRRA